VEEDKDRLLLLLLVIRPTKWGPNVERKTVFALRSPGTTSKSVNDALSLGCESREVDWFGSSLRTVAEDILSVDIKHTHQSSGQMSYETY
jgi:hypothetical protein